MRKLAILAFVLLALPALSATKVANAPPPNAGSCQEWDGFMTEVFGSYSNNMTVLARAYCSAYPSDNIDVAVCAGKSGEDLALCVSKLVRLRFKGVGTGDNCKEISCNLENILEKSGFDCTQISHKKTLGSGHVFTRCTQGTLILDLDPQTGPGHIANRTDACKVTAIDPVVDTRLSDAEVAAIESEAQRFLALQQELEEQEARFQALMNQVQVCASAVEDFETYASAFLSFLDFCRKDRGLEVPYSEGDRLLTELIAKGPYAQGQCSPEAFGDITGEVESARKIADRRREQVHTALRPFIRELRVTFLLPDRQGENQSPEEYHEELTRGLGRYCEQ